MLNLRTLIAGVACCFSGYAAAGELMVTSSTITYIPDGTIIDGTQELSIAKGHKISLISSTGKVVNLEGPFKGIPDPEPGKKNDDVLTKLSVIVSGQREDKSQLGAYRNTGKRTDPYLVDVYTGGTQCVVEGRDVVMWLPGGKLDKLWMERKGSDDAAVVRWKGDDSSTYAWPGSLPIVDGGKYQLLLQPEKRDVELTLRIVPAEASGNAALMAVKFGEFGCSEQAVVLLQ